MGFKKDIIAAMRWALAAALLLTVIGCAKAPPPKPVSEPGEKLYVLHGTIVSRDAGENSLRINHEAIPGFMEAMTMDYPLRGATVTQVPPDGSKVEARLHVHEEKYWVTDVKKVP